MIQRVLVPVDSVSENHPAFTEAQRRFPEAELHLLHVVGHPDPQTQAEQAERARRTMADLALGEVVKGQSPGSEILSRVQSGAFDLIVMGTAGQRGLGRRLMGSVAQRVIQDSPIPVVTVRLGSRAPSSDAATPGLSRALVLHDLSPCADQTLSFVRQALPQTEVALMHVVQARQSESHRAAARAFLNERGGGRIVQGDPADMAMVQARSGSYDLIALAASSKGRFDRLLFGSVADRLVRESPVAVLTLRA